MGNSRLEIKRDLRWWNSATCGSAVPLSHCIGKSDHRPTWAAWRRLQLSQGALRPTFEPSRLSAGRQRTGCLLKEGGGGGEFNWAPTPSLPLQSLPQTCSVCPFPTLSRPLKLKADLRSPSWTFLSELSRPTKTWVPTSELERSGFFFPCKISN